MATVVLVDGLNANLVRRWVKDRDGGPVAKGVAIRSHPAPTSSPLTLVPVTVSQAHATVPGEIQIERVGTRRPGELTGRRGGCLRRLAARAPAVIRPDQVWLAVEPVDLRTGIDGRSLQMQQTPGRSPCDSPAYAFRNRSGHRIRLLIWDRYRRPQ